MDTALDDFKKFLAFPSISSEASYKKDLLACLDWLEKYIQKIGFKTEVWPTSGHPTLFATYEVDKNKPTLLIYNHYDVQPVDPLDLWHTPPFEPTVKDNEIYARGAQDNKGQCFYVLQALKRLLETKKTLPINIKLIIEGEEEIGSQGLKTIVHQYKNKLKSDYLAIVDVGIPAPDTPAITLGTRGLVTFDIIATSSHTDLHSGSHGGLAYNPLRALSELLAKAFDEHGKITIPGFYDTIEPLTADEKKDIRFDFDEKQYEKDYGMTATGGEKHLHPFERNWLRPTFEINGLWGGYNKEGFKTVIPAKAFAKISCRLVRGQEVDYIGKLVKDYFEKGAPKAVTIHVVQHSGGGVAVLTSPHSKAVKAFQQAFAEVFDKPCGFILEGATIPIVAELQKASQSEVVFVGLGLGTDKIHAPNEHFGLDRIEKGITIMMRAMELLS